MADTIPDHVAMQPVTSSQIKAIGHDVTANQLYIEFPKKSGRSVYRYDNVTADQHAALIGEGKADGEHSVGRHFGQHIKAKADDHPFTKLDMEDGQ